VGVEGGRRAQLTVAEVHSMTGSGVASGVTELGELRIDLRSVNGRSLVLKQRLSAEALGLEPLFEAYVRQELARGTVTLNVERLGATPVLPDHRVLEQLVARMRELARGLGLPDDLSLRDVLALGGGVGRHVSSRLRTMPEQVGSLLRSAIADLLQCRKAEGAETLAAMRDHVREFEQCRLEAKARAPQLVDTYRERLLKRLREFLQQEGVVIEPADVVREVAIFAERVDVSEELQRLEAHVAELLSLLDRGGVVGRRLEFLLQELLRETNTLGAKSPDTQMSHCVVAMKSNIDKLKEQAANLE